VLTEAEGRFWPIYDAYQRSLDLANRRIAIAVEQVVVLNRPLSNAYARGSWRRNDRRRRRNQGAADALQPGQSAAAAKAAAICSSSRRFARSRTTTSRWRFRWSIKGARFGQTGESLACESLCLLPPGARCRPCVRRRHAGRPGKSPNARKSPTRRSGWKCYDAAAPRVKNALTVPVPKAEDKKAFDWFGFSRPAKPAQKPEEFAPAPEARGDQ
jgi:hypothetical protein